MFRELIVRFCSPVSVGAAFVLLALPLSGARADQCDDEWAAFQRGTPEIRAATARSATVDLFGDAEEQQKAKCESDRGFDELNRLVLDGIRRVEQACGSRRKLVCNAACQETALSESQKSTAYDCSPAALENVKRADQARKNQQDAESKAEWAVQNACIDVVAANAFPDLPHDREYKKNVSVCNANASKCKEIRDNLNQGSKWPADLTCNSR